MGNFGIRDGYTPRLNPAYFTDDRPDGKLWQPDVLPIAVHLARLLKLKTLVDVGCGRGEKLIPYAREFQIAGIDYGANIAYCRETHDFGTWLECDLQTNTPDVDSTTLKDALVICSDVVEHLPDPTRLILTLKAMVCCAPLVLLTTPDRERVYGYDQSGEPGNSHHCREWRLAELTAWLETFGLYAVWQGWTLNNDIDRVKSTSLLLLTGAKVCYDIPVEQLFEVDRA